MRVMSADGGGPVRRRRIWARIGGAACTAEELGASFCERFGELAPVETGVEPDTPQRLSEGATLTMRLPLRDTFQVRCEELTPRRVTLATLDGHPLAGVVRFHFNPQRSGLLFEAEIVATAATYPDLIAPAAGATEPRDSTWLNVVERVIALSGGTAPDGILDAEEELDEDEAQDLEEEIAGVIRRRRRANR